MTVAPQHIPGRRYALPRPIPFEQGILHRLNFLPLDAGSTML